jgi:hypothetical protein
VPPSAHLAISGSTGSSSGSSGGSSTTLPAKGLRGKGKAQKIAKILGRADHATVEIHAKTGWETVDWDRGKVTSSSPTSITLERPDGQSVTEAITSSTKYNGPGSVAVVGQPATVISLNGNALNVRQAKGKAAAGSTSAASGSATD